MATKEERWNIASDADLVKRGRILTVLGLVILCLGSLVTVALMSVTGTNGPQRTTAGPIRLVAPQVPTGNTGGSGGGSVSGGAGTGGDSGSTPGATTGGAENPVGTNPDGSPIASTQTGPSNVDPNMKPAPGFNVLGLPSGAAAPTAPAPPDDGRVYDL